jgi:hypothetical protein
VPLQPIKTSAWVAMSRRRIIGPIFFNETINSQRYRRRLLDPFINQLDDVELTNGYFQRDSNRRIFSWIIANEKRNIWTVINNYLKISSKMGFTNEAKELIIKN